MDVRRLVTVKTCEDEAMRPRNTFDARHSKTIRIRRLRYSIALNKGGLGHTIQASAAFFGPGGASLSTVAFASLIALPISSQCISKTFMPRLFLYRSRNWFAALGSWRPPMAPLSVVSTEPSYKAATLGSRTVWYLQKTVTLLPHTRTDCSEYAVFLKISRNSRHGFLRRPTSFGRGDTAELPLH